MYEVQQRYYKYLFKKRKKKCVYCTPCFKELRMVRRKGFKEFRMVRRKGFKEFRMVRRKGFCCQNYLAPGGAYPQMAHILLISATIRISQKENIQEKSALQSSDNPDGAVIQHTFSFHRGNSKKGTWYMWVYE